MTLGQHMVGLKMKGQLKGGGMVKGRVKVKAHIRSGKGKGGNQVKPQPVESQEMVKMHAAAHGEPAPAPPKKGSLVSIIKSTLAGVTSGKGQVVGKAKPVKKVKAAGPGQKMY